MKLTYFNFIPAVFTLLFTTQANAILIDNGLYTTDDTTGLDWLDLSATSNMSYKAAGANNPDWRYASNTEVENIFAMLFEGFYDNTGSGVSHDQAGYHPAAYADQSDDVDNFFRLFDSTFSYSDTISNYDYTYAYASSYGLYSDEDDILRMVGVNNTDITHAGHADYNDNHIFGTEYVHNYNYLRDHHSNTDFGTYLVRNTENTVSVPEPASLALMGLGLLGLVGFSRRRTHRQ